MPSKIRQAICLTTHKICTSSDKPLGLKVKTTSKNRFFSLPKKGAFSRHDNVRASSTLLIWLNENVQKTCFGHFVKRIIFRTFAQVKLRSAKRKTVFSFQISCPRHHIANAQQ